MLVYPNLNPVAISIGSIKVHWYGIMYMLGFLTFLYLGKWRLKKYKNSYPYLSASLVDDIMFYGALGVVIGGRLGYCFFYQPGFYLSHPLNIFKLWDGGMSYHGGMLGVFVAIYFISRKIKCSFFDISDFVAPLVPFGLFFGRIGNFINGELWGRITTADIPWAMVYPHSGSMLPRHPSEIYEAIGEGILLCLILWIYSHKPRKVGQVSGVFMIGYGTIRFCLEYFREPDSFLLGFTQKVGLSMGQVLCIPMILVGVVIYIYTTTKKAVTV